MQVQRGCAERTRDCGIREHMQPRRRRWIKMRLQMLRKALPDPLRDPHLNLSLNLNKIAAPKLQQDAVMDSHHNLPNKLNRLQILQHP